MSTRRSPEGDKQIGGYPISRIKEFLETHFRFQSSDLLRFFKLNPHSTQALVQVLVEQQYIVPLPPPASGNPLGTGYYILGANGEQLVIGNETTPASYQMAYFILQHFKERAREVNDNPEFAFSVKQE